MHNKVVFHTMKALNSFGFAALRFNFRGAGLSEGTHAEGKGEVEDVRAALDWLDSEFHLPLIFAGFSFGAAVGLQAACSDPRVQAAIGVGVPVGMIKDRDYDLSVLQACHKPKLFISGAQDEFASPTQLEDLFRGVPEPKRLVIVPNADHFFSGRLHELRESVEEWVRQTTS